MRILIIEDEFSLADVLAAAFQKENYLADTAYDGESGCLQALTGIYDAIVLDVMLPKMNGYEVLKKLRKENMDTPVLMLTAKSELDDKIKGLDSGADDYLTKPFETRELMARIRAITRRKGIVENDSLTFGDLELNLKQCTISNTANSQSVQLGKKEFQLMELFLRNQNQIITREQIAEKIWGFESDAEYNNVEVYISFTRRKLNFIGATARIKAVRGVGYLLELPSGGGKK
ncbi:MAG: response regulator transcription factor [Lachnospiraceae bacterium]|nr:response regulator transcription factor [Lachnospiraceae bacterium]